MATATLEQRETSALIADPQVRLESNPMVTVVVRVMKTQQ